MNASNIAHAVLALLSQALIGLTTGNWWAGAAFGSAFYLGREVAQFEADQIKQFGKRASIGSDEGMPWYQGFKVLNWGTDAQLDLIVPAVAVCVVALVMAKGL